MDAATTNTLIATAVPFFGTVLTGLVGVGVALAYKKLGLQQTATAAVVEHNAHAAIQGALVTGAGIYATQGKAAAVNYVAAVVPDAIEHFGLTSADVSTAIIGKAAALAGVTAPAGLVTAQPPAPGA